ncbi:plasmid mobilization protein [Massilia soli]|uniref:Ribbon-helix-helix protein RHH domain-containing protein n=1 Tax=Massilia soli TaxID=2792854 RepID=A0ABS7SLY9_9BURK|nr:hypothetical protein [Massilia soli]MBZ2207190.1 hypothetical protein [Massilia soli]
MDTNERERRCKTISMAATPREKQTFENFCSERDLLPGQMLRLMVRKVCPDFVEIDDRKETRTKPAALYLRLADKEFEELCARADQEGTTPQGWVRRQIRSTLGQTPQFNRTEENALLASNRELAHLGRNINQIAQRLNSSNTAEDEMKALDLAALSATIGEHRAKVAALINASWGRYGGEGRR